MIIVSQIVTEILKFWIRSCFDFWNQVSQLLTCDKCKRSCRHNSGSSASRTYNRIHPRIRLLSDASHQVKRKSIIIIIDQLFNYFIIMIIMIFKKWLFFLFRILPARVYHLVLDFFDTGLEPHDEWFELHNTLVYDL